MSIEDTIYSDADMGAAQDAFLDGNYIEMLKHAKTLVGRYPESAEALLWLGKACAGLKSRDDAIAAYKQAVELKPDFYDAWYGLGIQYYFSKRWDDAIAVYQAAIKLKPDYAEALRGLGMAYGASERYDDAIAAQRQRRGRPASSRRGGDGS